VIGGFVVGAIALVVIGVIVFGSGKFMEKTQKFILFFDGSVKGLNVGSKVALRGVRIGSVVDVALKMDARTMTSQIPVIIEVETDRIEVVHGEDLGHTAKNIQRLIEGGLRAQLQAESIVTGMLMIELDSHPDTPIRLVGKETRYPEIPTIPSKLSGVAKKISKLPIHDLFAKLVAAVDGIRLIVENREIAEIIHDVNLGLDDIRTLTSGLIAQVPNYESMLSEVTTTVGTEGREAVKAATSALKQAEITIKNIDENIVSKDARMNREVQSTLRELSAAARAIRVWAEYLERHPEALIRGKGER